MRIGIVTWFGGENFGTNLQAYALYRKIKDLGYDVFLIKKFERYKLKKTNILKSWVEKIPFLSFIKLFYYRIKFNNIKKIKIFKFIEFDLNVCNIYCIKHYNELLKKTDLFVSGSDQIWNPNYLDSFMMLDFAKDKKKISYASSIGTSKITEDEQIIYSQHLSSFSHIMVREKTGANILSKILGFNISCVLDPTFLLNAKEWISFSNKAIIESNIPSNYLLCYFIGNRNNYINDLQRICSIINIDNIVIIPSIENPNFSFENAFIYKNAGPKEFIKLIINAKIVCTDSFHATAFCLNLNKDFIEFLRFSKNDSKSQNSRIIDLLNHYNLQNKIYDDSSVSWNNAINFVAINKQLDYDRNCSLNKLIFSIEN